MKIKRSFFTFSVVMDDVLYVPCTPVFYHTIHSIRQCSFWSLLGVHSRIRINGEFMKDCMRIDRTVCIGGEA